MALEPFFKRELMRLTWCNEIFRQRVVTLVILVIVLGRSWSDGRDQGGTGAPYQAWRGSA